MDTKIQADAIFARAAWRLVPLILLMYIAAFLNRVNVGFAALTMNHDLGFSPEVYGWGTGVFFLGYLVFEVPANLTHAQAAWGVTSAVENPQFSTAIGLVKFAQVMHTDRPPRRFGRLF